MVITLTGENAHSLQAYLRKLSEDFVRKNGEIGIEKLDAAESTLDRIREALTSLPFLAKSKMVVLSSPMANKQFVEQAEQLLKETPDTTTLVLVEAKLDKRSKLVKILKKESDFQEFNELDRSALQKWLVGEAKSRAGELGTDEAGFLIDRVGQNQQLLASELNKLLLYNPQVTSESIELLTEPTQQSTIFQLLDAAFAGNRKKVQAIYDEQRALKVDPKQIIAMLAWQLHVLAIIKAAGHKSFSEIAKDAKISPFVVQKSLAIAKQLSLNEIKQLTADLLEIDLNSKRLSIDLDEALQYYLLSLARL